MASLPIETLAKLSMSNVGLVPFWTKRNPDYKSVMKTINARDDSLIENRGMWNTMKQRKRCIVIAQGFYEWLKKNGGKDKIPHYTKRPDGKLMCFAGLWDCVQYEGGSTKWHLNLVQTDDVVFTGSDEKLYTYTIITTDSNKQLNFLHDRMPVILENGSDELRTWLDPSRTEWSKELQSILKPYQAHLECYPVSKDVGKVGNNSPSFIIPITSSENKNNIANFFGNAKGAAITKPSKAKVEQEEQEVKSHESSVAEVKDEKRATVDTPRSEDNAPMPIPYETDTSEVFLKRKRNDDEPDVDEKSSPKVLKCATRVSKSPEKIDRKTRSATSNGSRAKESPKKASDRSQRITNFFNA